MRAARHRLVLVAQPTTQTWQQISPPLAHKLSDRALVARYALSLAVGLDLLAQPLEALHARVGQSRG